MIGRIGSLFGLEGFTAPQASEPDRAVRHGASDFGDRVRVLDRDPYLSVADVDLRLISVFDDLKYDRADMDLVSGPMRRRALEKLTPLGFKQVSGTVIEHRDEDIRMILPKIHALGASPFDATRYTPRRPQDYFILTPTQAACRMIDTYDHEEAVERIKTLIAKHPINLYRLMDYLEHNDAHRAFLGAIGHLRYVQREAVESEPLCRRRALR
ncbi:MAG: hypothetical protein AAGA26_03830 [Pseudomonadota bacterium]